MLGEITEVFAPMGNSGKHVNISKYYPHVFRQLRYPFSSYDKPNVTETWPVCMISINVKKDYKLHERMSESKVCYFLFGI
jgi:hypothetical protein